MTVSLNIKPGLQEKLAARARASGLPIERFIENVLEREALVADSSGSYSLPGSKKTGTEKAKAFRAWAKSFPPDLPVLSREDVSRESIYRRDE